MRKLLILPLLLVCSQAFAANCHETGCFYYLGPWVWVDDSWNAPNGTVGFVDLRSNPDLENAGVGFFATTKALGVEYTLVHKGDLTTDSATELMKDSWETVTGHRPDGAKVVDLLWDQLTNGADASGITAVMPLMPTSKGQLELWLGGHSLIKAERFVYGSHVHSLKVRDVLRNTYRKQRSTDRARGSNQYRKVLDFWGEKYRVKNPHLEFIPADLPKEPPLPHETTINETWDGCADSDSLNCDLTWTEVTSDIDLVSNTARSQTINGQDSARAESALSSDDHYAQISVVSVTANGGDHAGVTFRFNTANQERYIVHLARDGSGSDVIRAAKVTSAGTRTNLSSDQAVTVSLPDIVKGQMDGTTLTSYFNGSAHHNFTDTSFSGNLYTGIHTRRNSISDGVILDNFEAADLAVGGWTGKVNGVSNPAKVNGVSNANIASVSGVG